jgi:hypothetical protein
MAPHACTNDQACAPQGFCAPDDTAPRAWRMKTVQVRYAGSGVLAPPVCLSDSACKSPWSMCDPASGLCAACLADGDCLTSEHCSEGLCLPDVCQPGKAWCVASHARAVCSADGSAILELACDGAEVCEQGECLPVICTPEAKSCDGNAVRTCNLLGTAGSGPGLCAHRHLHRGLVRPLCNPARASAKPVCHGAACPLASVGAPDRVRLQRCVSTGIARRWSASRARRSATATLPS